MNQQRFQKTLARHHAGEKTPHATRSQGKKRRGQKSNLP